MRALHGAVAASRRRAFATLPATRHVAPSSRAPAATSSHAKSSAVKSSSSSSSASTTTPKPVPQFERASAQDAIRSWQRQQQILKSPPPVTGFRIALLIDGENIPFEHAGGIFTELNSMGVVMIRRIYADWSNTQLNNWRPFVQNHMLDCMHMFANSLGKGNSDSALQIDAMDLLHTRPEIDAFCIASSDADFTRVCLRLAAGGKLVLGVGGKQTPLPFVAACHRWVYLSELPQTTDFSVPVTQRLSPRERDSSAARFPAASTSSTTTASAREGRRHAERSEEWEKRNEALMALTRAWAANRDDQGYATLGSMAVHIKRADVWLEPANFGFDSLEAMVKGLVPKAFDASQRRGGEVLVRRASEVTE